MSSFPSRSNWTRSRLCPQLRPYQNLRHLARAGDQRLATSNGPVQACLPVTKFPLLGKLLAIRRSARVKWSIPCELSHCASGACHVVREGSAKIDTDNAISEQTSV